MCMCRGTFGQFHIYLESLASVVSNESINFGYAKVAFRRHDVRGYRIIQDRCYAIIAPSFGGNTARYPTVL